MFVWWMKIPWRNKEIPLTATDFIIINIGNLNCFTVMIILLISWSIIIQVIKWIKITLSSTEYREQDIETIIGDVNINLLQNNPNNNEYVNMVNKAGYFQ